MTNNNPVSETEWLTPGAAAAALGVDPRTVARLAAAGEIRAIRPAGKHHRYLAADVDAILARSPWSPA